MDDQIAPESPLVTYPPDAAAPGYNYREYYPPSPSGSEAIYEPMPGDEDFVDQTSADFSIEATNVPQSDLSRIAASDFSSPSFPSLAKSTNPVRLGAPLSSALAAASQSRLRSSLLSSTSVASLPTRVGVPSLLPGISSLSFAATTIPSQVPPIRSSITGETLANFSANQTLGLNASASATTTHQIYNVMAVPSQDLTKLTVNPTRSRVKQIIANLRSSINTYRIEEIVPFDLRNYLKMRFAALFPSSEEEREKCAFFLSWDKEFFCEMLDHAFPETGHYTQGAQTFLEKISQFSLCFDLSKPHVEQVTDNQLDKICEEHTERTREENLQAIKLLTKKLPTEGAVNWRAKMHQACTYFDKVETVSTWRSAFLAMLESARSLIKETESYGIACTFTENSMLKAKNSAKQATSDSFTSKRAAKRQRDESSGDAATGCTGCGRSNHQVGSCNFSKSQFFNKTTAPYKTSEAYTKLISSYPTMRYIPGHFSPLGHFSISTWESHLVIKFFSDGDKKLSPQFCVFAKYHGNSNFPRSFTK